MISHFRVEWLAPVAIAAAYVLVKFEANPTPLMGLPRPLIVAVAFAVSVQLVLTLGFRNASVAALITTAAVFGAVRQWPFAVIVLAVLGASVVIRRQGDAESRSAVGRGLADGPRAVGAIAVILAVITAVPVATRAVGELLAPESSGAPTIGPQASPDVFVVVLDAYPSTAILAESFGYDNAWFDTALESLGFEVAERARSNYTSTWASLASMLNMRYLDELPGLDSSLEPVAQHRALMGTIATGEALTTLREEGYEIVTVPSPFESVAISSADRVVPTGTPTSFEHALIQDSVAAGLLQRIAPDVLADLHRAGVQAALDATGDISAEDRDRPSFVFTHVMSPHAPYVFAADGGRVEQLECYPASCTFWGGEWDDLPGQVHHLNGAVLGMLEELVAANREALVIVMSDHGSQPSSLREDGVFESLLAARAPDHPGLLPDDASLVNLLPTVLNAYFGTELPMRPYRSWISEADAPMTMRSVDP